MVIATRSKNKQAPAVAKKSTAAASSKGKENVKPKKQTTRSNGAKLRKKRKDVDAGTSSKSKEKAAEEEEKSSRISNAIMKKIDAWWNNNNDTFVKFATEKQGWAENDAKDTVVAYKQFLILKRERKDWVNELLPCDSVIKMIQQHQKNESLDFVSDLKHLCGHDFEGADILLDRQEDNFNRQIVTLEAVKQRFGEEFDEKLWDIHTFDLLEINKEGEIVRTFDLCRGGISNPLEKELGEISYHCGKYEKMQFVLHHNQEEIDPKEDTILSLGLTAFNTVIVVRVDFIWLQVEIKDGSDMTRHKRFFYVTQKKLPIVKDKLACIDVESEYVYFFNGKRLYGFETPLSLQMKHFDVIEAVPAEDFKYPKCTCCRGIEV